MLEVKKPSDEVSAGLAPGGTQSPGLMPGMGTPGMMAVGMPPGPRPGTAQNPVGGPASVISAGDSFNDVGMLPTPDPSLVPKQSGGKCSSCGSALRPNAKICTSCGIKT